MQAADILGINDITSDKTIENAIMNVKSFAESVSKPVVITIKDIDSNYLFGENGKELMFAHGNWITQNFRYTKEYDLSLENAEYLK